MHIALNGGGTELGDIEHGNAIQHCSKQSVDLLVPDHTHLPCRLKTRIPSLRGLILGRLRQRQFVWSDSGLGQLRPCFLFS